MMDLPPVVNRVKKRSLVAFWLLGLCNNYGYVVMLSAASDIIQRNFNDNNATKVSSDNLVGDLTNARDCNIVSTGAVLLADIIPSVAIKMFSPFFPLWIHFRIFLVVAFNAIGYILVAESNSEVMALSGIVAIALGSGLGEASLLAYMPFFQTRDVISMWSSGTGGAGFFGALSYMGISLIFPDNRATPLLIFLIVPVLMAISFWLLMQHPSTKLSSESETAQGFDSNTTINSATTDSTVGSSEILRRPLTPKAPELTLKEKIKYIPSLMKFMIPFATVYLFEYFINQGLLELISFPLTWLARKDQYIWYQLDYQIGVFVSRSSISVLQIRKTWILSILQLINVVLLTSVAVTNYLPNIYIMFLIVFWEGCLGGASYVNTYNRINREVPEDKREYSMAMNSFGDASAITIAGFLAMPAHNYICQLPVYS